MSPAVLDKTVSLGKYSLRGLWLAPMAGYTDIAFRTLAREYGAGHTVTEMVSVRGLVRGNDATEILLRTAPVEKPSCVQLFGNDPDEFYRAAKILDCDVIDINMGCPMPKIVKNGDGSALLDAPVLAGDIVRATIDGAGGKPVTVKTRLGRRTGELTVDALIDSVEKAGASAVTLHGRYAEQRYSGVSDRELCKKIAARHGVPIVYNGDVAIDDTDDFSCFAAVAVGRAALSDIGIFSGVQVDPFDVALKHISLLKEHFDGRYVVAQARKFFVHYFKSMRGGKAVRAEVNVAQSPDEVVGILLRAQRNRA